jgi:hypothetical protein
MIISLKGVLEHPVTRDFLEALGRGAALYSSTGQISLLADDTHHLPSKESQHVSAVAKSNRFFGKRCEITSI